MNLYDYFYKVPLNVCLNYLFWKTLYEKLKKL